MPARIQHIACHLPEKDFSNEEFFNLFPEMKDNANLHKIGIVNRKIAAAHETASDLAILAAKKLFKEGAVALSDIDFLLYVSLDMDYYLPATSSFVHRELGLPDRCGTLDHTHGCSAYVYGLTIAQNLVESAGMKNVLLLTSNVLTKQLHPKDKASRFLFGDGAAATLITHSEQQGIGKPVFGTDSKGMEKIIKRHGGSRAPITNDSYTEVADEYGNISSNAHFFMDGVGIFLFSIHRVPTLVKDTLARNGMAMEDIDLFVFHQASYLILDTIAKKLNLPREKVYNNSATIGNTVGSSIPIALVGALAEGKAKPGDTVLLAGFGVGLSWAATIITI